MSNPNNPTTGTDFFGQPLAIGDEVAFMCPNYRWMIMGKVIKFTPKTILLEYVETTGSVTMTYQFRSDRGQLIKKPLDCPK